jgi:hypothetical protein
MTSEEEDFLNQLHAAIMYNVPREICPPEGTLMLTLKKTCESVVKKYNLFPLEVLDETFEEKYAIEKGKIQLTIGKCFQVPVDHEAHYIAPFGVLTWVVNKNGKVCESSSMDRIAYEGTYFYDGRRIVALPNPYMSNIYCGLAKALLKKQQSLDEAEINVEAALVVDENNKLAITLRNEIIAAKN